MERVARREDDGGGGGGEWGQRFHGWMIAQLSRRILAKGELRRTIKENMSRILRVKDSLDSRYREKLKWGRWRRRRRRSLVLLVS